MISSGTELRAPLRPGEIRLARHTQSPHPLIPPSAFNICQRVTCVYRVTTAVLAGARLQYNDDNYGDNSHGVLSRHRISRAEVGIFQNLLLLFCPCPPPPTPTPSSPPPGSPPPYPQHLLHPPNTRDPSYTITITFRVCADNDTE